MILLSTCTVQYRLIIQEIKCTSTYVRKQTLIGLFEIFYRIGNFYSLLPYRYHMYDTPKFIEFVQIKVQVPVQYGTLKSKVCRTLTRLRIS